MLPVGAGLAVLIGCAEKNSHAGAVSEFSLPLVSPQSPDPPGLIVPGQRVGALLCPPCPTANAPRSNPLALPFPAQSVGGDRWQIRSSSWRGLRQFASGHQPLLRPALRSCLGWTVFPTVSAPTSAACSQTYF